MGNSTSAEPGLPRRRLYRRLGGVGLALLGACVLTTRGPPASAPTEEAVGVGAPVAEAQSGQIQEGFLLRFLSETPSPATLDQEKLMAWARWRFGAAGLELPPVEIRFLESSLACGGREGLYHPDTAAIYMCTTRPQTLLHELAHAWTDARLSEAHRNAFVHLRGLESWDRREDPWELRGTEHASEIIAWALMDRPIHVPTNGTEGDIVFRLLSIPNSDVDSLTFGYQFLTGSDPPFRNASEWEGILEVGNPELRHIR